jgi:hypothetical protein
VTLRNLVIVHLASSIDGIHFAQGAELNVAECEIANMGGNGIAASAAGSKVTVKNTVLRGEFLLLVCRGEVPVRDVVLRGDEYVEVERWPTLDERIKAATVAAPFYAPKLAAQVAAVAAPEGNPIEELMKAVAESATNRARPAG